MTTTDEAIEQAAKIGHEHGNTAADWWIQDGLGGRATGDRRDVAAAVLAGLEDGDPEILDSLPGPDLSGQWADEYSSQDLLNDVGLNDGDTSFHAGLTGEIFDAYEMAYTQAVEDAVSEYAKAALS